MLRDTDNNKGKYHYKKTRENIRIKLVDNDFLTNGQDPTMHSTDGTKLDFYESKKGSDEVLF